MSLNEKEAECAELVSKKQLGVNCGRVAHLSRRVIGGAFDFDSFIGNCMPLSPMITRTPGAADENVRLDPVLAQQEHLDNLRKAHVTEQCDQQNGPVQSRQSCKAQ